MCTGIALIQSEISVASFEEFALARRVHCRGGEPEVRFFWQAELPLLPIWHEGRMHIVRWGNRDRQSRLPATGWTWQSTVENGGWNALQPVLVTISANFGFEKGVWFRIREGVRGVLVRDEQERPRVFMICEPSTRYYRVMTRSDRMPELIDETI